MIIIRCVLQDRRQNYSQQSKVVVLLNKSFTRFDNADFLDELNMEIENFKCSQTDSNMNFATWNTLFLSVLNKHAPIKETRVKRTSKPVWLTEEITNAQQNRNYYYKKQDWKKFKLWRNKTKDLIRSANQSRTNKRSPDYCPGITTTMKNKKHCCKHFVKISAVA